MADSTAWTLELIDHGDNTIVLIPGTTEFASNYYFHLQDGGFNISPPEKKRSWAGENNVASMGARLIHETFQNREITIDLNIVATDRNYLIDAFQELFKFANEVGYYAQVPKFRKGFWYMKKQWLGTTDTIYSYIYLFACDVEYDANLYSESGINFYNGKYIVPVRLKMVSEPAWRDTAPFLNDGTRIINHAYNSGGAWMDDLYSAPCISIPASSLTGDISPLLKIECKGLRDGESTKHVTKFHFAVRSTGIDSDDEDFYPRLGAQEGDADNGADIIYNVEGTGPGGPNLISNEFFYNAGGGGADVFSSWTESAGTGSIEQSDEQYHRQLYSAKLTAGAGANTYITQTKTVVASTDYTFNAFCYVPSGNSACRYRIYDNSNLADIVSTTTLSNDGEMFFGTYNRFTTPVGCTEIIVYIYCPSTSGYYAYVDAVTIGRYNLVEVSPTATTESLKLTVFWGGEFLESEPVGNYKGTFRVRLRAKLRSGVSAVTDVAMRAKWDVGQTPLSWENVGDGRQYYLSAVDEWQLLDLGKFTFTPNIRADIRGALSSALVVGIFTEHDNIADIVDIDYVELVPVDEGYGWFEGSIAVGSDAQFYLIDQVMPGEQDIWFESNLYFANAVQDYDLQRIELMPGRDYKIWLNCEDEDGASQRKHYLWFEVWAVERRLLIA